MLLNYTTPRQLYVEKCIVELRVKCIHPDGAIEIETVVKENPLAIEQERAMAQRKHWPAANLAVANSVEEAD